MTPGQVSPEHLLLSWYPSLFAGKWTWVQLDGPVREPFLGADGVISSVFGTYTTVRTRLRQSDTAVMTRLRQSDKTVRNRLRRSDKTVRTRNWTWMQLGGAVRQPLLGTDGIISIRVQVPHHLPKSGVVNLTKSGVVNLVDSRTCQPSRMPQASQHLRPHFDRITYHQPTESEQFAFFNSLDLYRSSPGSGNLQCKPGRGLENNDLPRSRITWPTPAKRLSASRCRATMARIRQSRPDSGLGFQVKVLQNFYAAPPSLGNWRRATEP